MSEPLPNSTPEINDALGTKETSLGNTDVVVGSGHPNGGVPVEGDDEGEESDTYDDFEGEGDDKEGGEEYDEEEDEDEGTGEKKSSLTALLIGNAGPGPAAPDHQGVKVIEDDEGEDEDDDEEYVDEPENGYGHGHGDSHPGAVLVEDDGDDYDNEGGDEEDEGPEIEELPDPNFAPSNGSKKRTIDEVHEDADEDGEEGAGGVKKVKA